MRQNVEIFGCWAGSMLLCRVAIGLLVISAGSQAYGQSAFPPCPEETGVIWAECVGSGAFSDGSTYVGEWRNDSANGTGTRTWPDGRKYVGQFSDGKVAGEGTFTWSDGRKYVGQFRDNKIEGYGTLSFSDGREYVGEFRDEKRNGRGTFRWADGATYTGEFRDDQGTGWGTFTAPNGAKHVGEFRDGLAHGEGIEYNQFGWLRRSGSWAKGQQVKVYTLDASRFPFNPSRLDASDAGRGEKAERNRLAAEAEAQRKQRIALQVELERAERERLAAEAEAERRKRESVEAQLAETRKQAAAATAAAQRLRPAVTRRPEKRVALVVGNSVYVNSPTLQNPSADATLVAAALRQAGFETVTMKTDLSQQAMLSALKEFASVADAADWAVVYYAGHGIEFGGNNYLIPIDARLRADRDIDLEGVELGKVISAVEGAKRLRLIILDACRDNPFANQMRRAVVSRSLGRGLAKVEPEPGTMIAYAAKHGETALDGVGTVNSPFAQALVRRISQAPPLEIRRLFDFVRDDVLEATGKQQQPFSYGSLSAKEDFYFTEPAHQEGGQ